MNTKKRREFELELQTITDHRDTCRIAEVKRDTGDEVRK